VTPEGIARRLVCHRNSCINCMGECKRLVDGVKIIEKVQIEVWKEAVKLVRQAFNRDTGTELEKEFLRRAGEREELP